jgi:hypothetical protein
VALLQIMKQIAPKRIETGYEVDLFSSRSRLDLLLARDR